MNKLLVGLVMVALAAITTAPAMADDVVPQINTQVETDPLHHPDAEVVSAALDLAKYCANEAGLNSHNDCRLIWQVASTHGETWRERMAFLRRHSRCVLTVDPPEDLAERGNCRWSRELTWSNARPAHWPEHLDWTRRHASRWRAVRELALQLVTTPEPPRQCNGTPITWGGTMDADRAQRRRLIPLDCGDTLNTGYTRARSTVAPSPHDAGSGTMPATVAAGHRSS